MSAAQISGAAEWMQKGEKMKKGLLALALIVSVHANAVGIIPVVDVGTPRPDPKIISGSGARVPLSDAVRMIMQFDGWHAYLHGVDGKTMVSWQAGIPWNLALKKIAEQAGITLEIDWNEQSVTLVPGKREQIPAKTLPAPASFPTSAKSETSATSPESWGLQAEDKTVKGSLTRWSKAAGWHFSWEMPDGEDLKFDQSASFTGDFASAVKSLAATLAQSPMPIKAILYSGNHVLRVVPATSGAE